MANKSTDDLFDTEGDSLMAALNEKENQKDAILRLVHHPNFLLGTFKITSLSITDEPTTFTAQPVMATRDVNNEDTILFRLKSKKSNGNSTTKAILIDNICSMQPVQTDEKLFQKEPVPSGTAHKEAAHIPVPGKFSDSYINTSLPDVSEQFEDFQPQRSSTMERKDTKQKPFDLPILSNGKVDLFLLHQWHKQEQKQTKSSVSFTQWRQDTGLTKQMQQKGLKFSNPVTFNELTDKQAKVQAWQESFDDHKLSFDEWHGLTILQQNPGKQCQCCDCDMSSQCMCCQCLESQAQEMLNYSYTSPKGETSRMEYSRQNSNSLSQTSQSFTMISDGSKSLDKSNTIKSNDSYICPRQSSPQKAHISDASSCDFAKTAYNMFEHKQQDQRAKRWAETETDKEGAHKILQQWQECGGWLVLRIPFSHFVMQKWPCYTYEHSQREQQTEEHWQIITSESPDFTPFTDAEITSLYDSKGESCTKIFENMSRLTPTDFLPNGKLAHIYIPSYNYIPEECFTRLNLRNIKLTTAAKTILWHKLLHNRQMAQTLMQETDLDDINPDGWTKYLVHNITNEHDMSLIDIIQHTEALKYNEKYALNSTGVYDTLFRPLERLCGIDMPLHDKLMKSRFDMKSRTELFKELTKLTGFDLPMDIDKHYVFKHLSFVRHLTCDNLIPKQKHASGPLMTIPPLYPYEIQPFERCMSYSAYAEVHYTLMAETKNFHDTMWLMPLPDQITQKFTAVGGENMSILRMREIIQMQNDIVKGHTQLKSPQKQKDDSMRAPVILPSIKRDDDDSDQSTASLDHLEGPSNRSFSEILKLQPRREQRVPAPKKTSTNDRFSFKFMNKN